MPSVSVTTVMDYLTEPELLNWYTNNSKAKTKAISDEALRIGGAVDLLVQQDVKEGGYVIPAGDEAIVNCMKAWESFKKDYPSFVPSVLEMQTELRMDEVIGHPDFIHADGITDLKCSTGIRPRYWTQVSQYFRMRFLNYTSDNFVAVLRLDKKLGIYEYKIIKDIEYISYENKIFDAYLLAYNHNRINRELIRLQLEKEFLL